MSSSIPTPASQTQKARDISRDASLALLQGETFANNIILGRDAVDLSEAVTLRQLMAFLPIGISLPYVSNVIPTGWLLEDGGAYSNTTYSSLYALMVTSKGIVTMALASPIVFTCIGHGLVTGECVSLTTAGFLPIELLAFTNYFAVRVSADTFNLATTFANAIAGTKINALTTSVQRGPHTLIYNPFRISGPSKFCVPDMRAAVPSGAGTSTGFSTNVTRVLGGMEDDALQEHCHGLFAYMGDTTADTNIVNRFPSNIGDGFTNIAPTFSTGISTQVSPIGRVSASETKMKNVAKNWIIKYQ